jgi:O-antigen ligase
MSGRASWYSLSVLAIGGTTAAAVGVGVLGTRESLPAALVLAGLPLLLVAAGSLVETTQRLIAFNGHRIVGGIWLILIASTLVWRGRSTQSLESNPLDAAALVRVALIGLGGLLALMFLAHPPKSTQRRRLPLPVTLLVLYVVAAFAGAATSRLPMFAGYRAVELGAGALALLAVFRSGEENSMKAVELVLAVIGAIVIVAWIEAIAVPSRGWEPAYGGVIKHALIGYEPSFSSNTLGEYGALLAVWGIVNLRSGRYRRGFVLAAAVGGVATLVVTQYRTGIIAFGAACLVIVWQRRQLVLGLLVIAATLIVIGSGGSHSLARQGETAFARGNTEAVSTLDSRTVYWSAALPYIEARPVQGWGLNVASRDVLATLGLQDVTTIHSTWVEALLGTGIVGTSFLAGAYLLTLGAAARRRRDATGLALMAMALVMLVRSATGSTVELFDLNYLLLGALALAAAARPSATVAPTHTTAPAPPTSAALKTQAAGQSRR